MADTDKQPAISIDANRSLKMRVATLGAVIVGVIGGAVWATNLTRDVSELDEKVTDIKEELSLMRRYLARD